MTAREAFGPERWDAAVAGNADALSEVAAWLRADGLPFAARLALERRGAEQHGAARASAKPNGRAALGAALARLLSMHGTIKKIQPAQIAAARFGDFERQPENGSGPVLRWNLRRCGWATGGWADLTGDDLDAWRAVVRHGRSATPAPDDPLLAPRPSGKVWDARAVRLAAIGGP